MVSAAAAAGSPPATPAPGAGGKHGQWLPCVVMHHQVEQCAHKRLVQAVSGVAQNTPGGDNLHIACQPASCIALQASAARHTWQQAVSSTSAGGTAASTPGTIWAWLQQSTRGKTTMTKGGLKSYKPVTAGATADSTLWPTGRPPRWHQHFLCNISQHASAVFTVLARTNGMLALQVSGAG